MPRFPSSHRRAKPEIPSSARAAPPSTISPPPIFCPTTAEWAGGMRRRAGISTPVLKMIAPTRTIAA